MSDQDVERTPHPVTREPELSEEQLDAVSGGFGELLRPTPVRPGFEDPLTAFEDPLTAFEDPLMAIRKP